jgi:hypothetical protein
VAAGWACDVLSKQLQQTVASGWDGQMVICKCCNNNWRLDRGHPMLRQGESATAAQVWDSDRLG